MKANTLIKPIFTEKISILEERQNKYAFIVNRSSNKIEIKEAVEQKFDVAIGRNISSHAVLVFLLVLLIGFGVYPAPLMAMIETISTYI